MSAEDLVEMGGYPIQLAGSEFCSLSFTYQQVSFCMSHLSTHKQTAVLYETAQLQEISTRKA